MSSSNNINSVIKRKLEDLKETGDLRGTLIEKLDINSDVCKILTIELNKEILKYHRPRTTRYSSRVYDPAESYKKYLGKMITDSLSNGGVIIDEEMKNMPIKIEMVVGTTPVKSGNSIVKLALMLSGKIFKVKTPDVDNYQKTCFDTLNTILFNDDKQIVEANIKKVYSEEEFTHIVIHYYRDMSNYKGTIKELLSQGIVTEKEIELAKKIKKG